MYIIIFNPPPHNTIQCTPLRLTVYMQILIILNILFEWYILAKKDTVEIQNSVSNSIIRPYNEDKIV